MTRDLDLDRDRESRFAGRPVASSLFGPARRWLTSVSSPRSRWRAVGDALTVAGLLYIALVWMRVVPYAPPVPDYGPMFDARGFWIAWDGGLYDIPWGEYEAYVYSPAFAQLLWPFTLLPWPVFAAGWTIASIGCLFWMRVPWMIAFPGVIDDILRGNIHVFLAASIVLALRRPAAWAFGILTKVTPAIGLVWHMVRAEWRAVAIALGVTGVIVGVSFVFSADLWLEWFGLLADNAGTTARIRVIPLPLIVRLPIAVVLIAYGARTDRAWLVPIGVMLGLPNVWTSSTAMLAGAVSLWLAARRQAAVATA
jgi:Glycosyltransferase family 87